MSIHVPVDTQTYLMSWYYTALHKYTCRYSEFFYFMILHCCTWVYLSILRAIWGVDITLLYMCISVDTQSDFAIKYCGYQIMLIDSWFVHLMVFLSGSQSRHWSVTRSLGGQGGPSPGTITKVQSHQYKSEIRTVSFVGTTLLRTVG